MPVNFSRTLAMTGTAAVQTVFDATDVNTTNIAIGYAQGVIAQTTTDFESAWAAAHGVRVPRRRAASICEPRVWFNEGLDSRNFIIPGVVAVILGLVGAQLTSLTVSPRVGARHDGAAHLDPGHRARDDDRQAGAVLRRSD